MAANGDADRPRESAIYRFTIFAQLACPHNIRAEFWARTCVLLSSPLAELYQLCKTDYCIKSIVHMLFIAIGCPTDLGPTVSQAFGTALMSTRHTVTQRQVTDAQYREAVHPA